MKPFPNLENPPLLGYPAERPGSTLSYNNNIFSINGAPCTGHYIFVVLTSTNPFGATFQDHNGLDVDVYLHTAFHHDDLALGQPVNYAGTLDFMNGQLTSWSNHSGHYRPDAIFRDQAPTAFNVPLFRVVLNDGTLA